MIFNSLGSNYNLKFVLKTLFAVNNRKYRDKLISFLNKKYSGETVLLYKGREAIKLALDLLKLPRGSKVGINGFTCYVVYKAIVDAGYKPELIDIDKTLNFSHSELKKHKDLKVVIVQNTLGIPCDIEEIKKHCLDNKIILIEDLAHSVGLIYKNGQEAGTQGDFIALSFSQDKMIDSVSGGALVVRNSKYKRLSDLTFRNVSLQGQIKDRFYPLWTYKIRNTYGLGLGKVLHFILKKSGLLSQPLSSDLEIDFHNLPDWYCSLIKYQFSQHTSDLSHRKTISAIYVKNINNKVIVNTASDMRFPILVSKRTKLLEYLKARGIFLSDIWYDAPIAPIKFLKLTDYNGECPISEKISKQILNLPTHINISLKQAENISKIINIWLNTR